MKVNLTDILTEEFLNKYTDWKKLEEFEQHSPVNLQNEYYWQYLDNQAFNQYIADHSDFHTWNSLLRQATREFMAERVGV